MSSFNRPDPTKKKTYAEAARFPSVPTVFTDRNQNNNQKNQKKNNNLNDSNKNSGNPDDDNKKNLRDTDDLNGAVFKLYENILGKKPLDPDDYEAASRRFHPNSEHWRIIQQLQSEQLELLELSKSDNPDDFTKALSKHPPDTAFYRKLQTLQSECDSRYVKSLGRNAISLNWQDGKPPIDDMHHTTNVKTVRNTHEKKDSTANSSTTTATHTSKNQTLQSECDSRYVKSLGGTVISRYWEDGKPPVDDMHHTTNVKTVRNTHEKKDATANSSTTTATDTSKNKSKHSDFVLEQVYLEYESILKERPLNDDEYADAKKILTSDSEEWGKIKQLHSEAVEWRPLFKSKNPWDFHRALQKHPRGTPMHEKISKQYSGLLASIRNDPEKLNLLRNLNDPENEKKYLEILNPNDSSDDRKKHELILEILAKHPRGTPIHEKIRKKYSALLVSIRNDSEKLKLLLRNLNDPDKEKKYLEILNPTTTTIGDSPVAKPPADSSEAIESTVPSGRNSPSAAGATVAESLNTLKKRYESILKERPLTDDEYANAQSNLSPDSFAWRNIEQLQSEAEEWVPLSKSDNPKDFLPSLKKHPLGTRMYKKVHRRFSELLRKPPADSDSSSEAIESTVPSGRNSPSTAGATVAESSIKPKKRKEDYQKLPTDPTGRPSDSSSEAIESTVPSGRNSPSRTGDNAGATAAESSNTPPSPPPARRGRSLNASDLPATRPPPPNPPRPPSNTLTWPPRLQDTWRGPPGRGCGSRGRGRSHFPPTHASTNRFQSRHEPYRQPPRHRGRTPPPRSRSHDRKDDQDVVLLGRYQLPHGSPHSHPSSRHDGPPYYQSRPRPSQSNYSVASVPPNANDDDDIVLRFRKSKHNPLHLVLVSPTSISDDSKRLVGKFLMAKQWIDSSRLVTGNPRDSSDIGNTNHPRKTPPTTKAPPPTAVVHQNPYLPTRPKDPPPQLGHQPEPRQPPQLLGHPAFTKKKDQPVSDPACNESITTDQTNTRKSPFESGKSSSNDFLYQQPSTTFRPNPLTVTKLSKDTWNGSSTIDHLRSTLETSSGVRITHKDIRFIPFVYERFPGNSDLPTDPERTDHPDNWTLPQRWKNASHVYITFPCFNTRNSSMKENTFRVGQLKHARSYHYQLRIDECFGTMEEVFSSVPDDHGLQIVWIPPTVQSYSDSFFFTHTMKIGDNPAASVLLPTIMNILKSDIPVKQKEQEKDHRQSNDDILDEYESADDSEETITGMTAPETTHPKRQRVFADFLFSHYSFSKDSSSSIGLPMPALRKFSDSKDVGEAIQLILKVVPLIHQHKDNEMGLNPVFDDNNRNHMFSHRALSQCLHPDHRIETTVDAHVPGIEFVRMHETDDESLCICHRDINNSTLPNHEAVFFAEFTYFDENRNKWIRLGFVATSRKSIDDFMTRETFLKSVFRPGLRSNHHADLFSLFLRRCYHLMSRNIPDPQKIRGTVTHQSRYFEFFKQPNSVDDDWTHNLHNAGTVWTDKLSGDCGSSLRFSIINPSHTSLYQPFVASILRIVYYFTEGLGKNHQFTSTHLCVLCFAASRLHGFPVLFSRASNLFRKIDVVAQCDPESHAMSPEMLLAVFFDSLRRTVDVPTYLYPTKLGPNGMTTGNPPNYRWRSVSRPVKQGEYNITQSRRSLLEFVKDVEDDIGSFIMARSSTAGTKLDEVNAILAAYQSGRRNVRETRRKYARDEYKYLVRKLVDTFRGFVWADSTFFNHLLGITSLIGFTPHCFYDFYAIPDGETALTNRAPYSIRRHEIPSVETMEDQTSALPLDDVTEGIFTMIHHSSLHDDQKTNDSPLLNWPKISKENFLRYLSNYVTKLVNERDYSLFETDLNSYECAMIDDNRDGGSMLPPFSDRLVTYRVGASILEECLHHYHISDEITDRSCLEQRVSSGAVTIQDAFLTSEYKRKDREDPISERHDVVDISFPTPHYFREGLPPLLPGEVTTRVGRKEKPSGPLCLWTVTGMPFLNNEKALLQDKKHKHVICSQTSVDEKIVTRALRIGKNYNVTLGTHMAKLVRSYYADPFEDAADWMSHAIESIRETNVYFQQTRRPNNHLGILHSPSVAQIQPSQNSELDGMQSMNQEGNRNQGTQDSENGDGSEYTDDAYSEGGDNESDRTTPSKRKVKARSNRTNTHSSQRSRKRRRALLKKDTETDDPTYDTPERLFTQNEDDLEQKMEERSAMECSSPTGKSKRGGAKNSPNTRSTAAKRSPKSKQK